MSRIEPVDAATATEPQLAALEEIRDAWGAVPNLGGVVAHSRALTTALLTFDEALEHGAFSGAVAEQLAIAVADENGCLYCLAAHTAAARAYGVSNADVADAREGRASDPKIATALTFAQTVVRKRGLVSDLDVSAVRAAGYTDAELLELIGHAIANTLTNYLHHVAEVPVDFPAVAPSDRRRTQAA
jgi:uncharacterized peroxidase-related enzyme